MKLEIMSHMKSNACNLRFGLVRLDLIFGQFDRGQFHPPKDDAPQSFSQDATGIEFFKNVHVNPSFSRYLVVFDFKRPSQ